MSNNQDQGDMQKYIEELTLLLIYLTHWNEKVSGVHMLRAWKGYDFDVLNVLAQQGFVSDSRRSKSVIITDEGLARAEALMEKYHIPRS